MDSYLNKPVLCKYYVYRSIFVCMCYVFIHNVHGVYVLLYIHVK